MAMNALFPEDQSQGPRLTERTIRDSCTRHGLYITPDVNDKLFLHLGGFRKIEGLEKYTGLRVLYLETNAIAEIEGLDHCPDLRCLFLQENMIEEIRNLDNVPLLDSLNLADNQLRRISGLSKLGNLKTLQLARNRLSTPDDLRGLLECPSIEILDLSDNRISDPEAVLAVLCKMPKLGVLNLEGNPVIQNVINYRRTLITQIPTLKHLDNRPVFADERRVAEAWARGGKEAEQAERRAIVQEQRERDRVNFEYMQRLMHRRNGGARVILGSNDGKGGISTNEENSSAPDDSEGGSDWGTTSDAAEDQPTKAAVPSGTQEVGDVLLTDLEAEFPGPDMRDGIARQRRDSGATEEERLLATLGEIGSDEEEDRVVELPDELPEREIVPEITPGDADDNDDDLPDLEDDLDLMAELD